MCRWAGWSDHAQPARRRRGGAGLVRADSGQGGVGYRRCQALGHGDEPDRAPHRQRDGLRARCPARNDSALGTANPQRISTSRPPITSAERQIGTTVGRDALVALTALAVGLAPQEGRGRAAIRDGLDVHRWTEQRGDAETSRQETQATSPCFEAKRCQSRVSAAFRPEHGVNVHANLSMTGPFGHASCSSSQVRGRICPQN